MKEEIDDELIDTLYEASNEDDEDKGPRKEKYPLPPIIKDWIKVGSEYSRYNKFPLTMCYFNIMGQIVKDFIQIPHGANRLDSRLHFVWLQTARTGKSATWKLMNTTLQGVYENINNIAIANNLDTFDTFDISVYTSAGLIGTFTENDAGSQKFDDNIEEGVELIKSIDGDGAETIEPFNPIADPAQAYTEKWINSKKRFIVGSLHGSGIAHWDEFESSGIFKMKKHNEDMLLTFQTFLNDIDIKGDGHIMTKSLAGVVVKGKCDCQRSLYATSYVPENLAAVIRNSGVLQRAFVFVREVPNHTRRKMHKTVVDNIGKEIDDEIPVQPFIDHFTEVYKNTLEKWNKVDKKTTNMIEISDDVTKVIHQYRKQMEKYIKTCRPEIQTAVESFSINLILYNTKIAMYIALSEGRFDINVNDVHCAGRLVEKAYKELVGWLEQGIRTQRQSLSNNNRLNQFKQSYFDSTKDDEGFTEKTPFLGKCAKLLQLSPKQTYLNYNKLSEEFEEVKKGRTVWVKYIGD